MDAEEAVLGSIINPNIAHRGEAVVSVSAILRPEHFENPQRRRIYEAVLAIHDRWETPDAISVIAELDRRGDLKTAGGSEFVFKMAQSSVTDANAKSHARIVLESATLRTLISVGQQLTEKAQQSPGDISALITTASEQLMAAQMRGDRSIVSSSDVALRVGERIEAYGRGDPSVVIKTPYADLNKIITGFRPSEYFVIAARPGMGKSALAHMLALYAASRLAVPVGIVTLEMSREEVVERMACAMAHADSKQLRENTIDKERKTAVVDALSAIASMPIVFDESDDTDPMRLRATIRRMSQQHGVKMVILDHIQLMAGPKKSENRQQEVTAISRALKIAAKESNVALIALSQLNRHTENASDKGRPRLADLRESGSIEQDADVVMFIYHRWKYDKSALRNRSEFIIEKQRNGPMDSCEMEWTPKYTRFDDWIPGDSEGRT